MIKVYENDKRFYLAPSKLPAAGQGVFAKEPLKKGQHLEIFGVLVNQGSVADKCTNYASRYKFKGENSSTRIVPIGFGGMVNHANEKSEQNAELRNIRSKSKNPTSSNIAYVFIRDISKDEEILGYYGDTYNEAIQWIGSANATLTNNQDEWQRFLGFDLYNLGILQDNKIRI